MIDLHVHSVYSDGTNTPAELIKLAEGRGLKAMAITDHDTIGGIVPLLEAAKDSSVEPVPGIELSAECQRRMTAQNLSAECQRRMPAQNGSAEC